MRVAYRTNQAQGVVKVAIDRQHLGAVDERLRQFAERDLAARDDDRTGEAGAGGVGGGGSGGITRARADDGGGSILHRLGDGKGHTPVFE